ncbi:MAG: hypothetical protein PHF63_06900 [Herbinix sp.]|nr:hypothetical protein [Herbinix sp.]
MQTVESYMGIINKSVIKEFGTLFHGRKCNQELKLHIDDPSIPEDHLKNLIDLAARAIYNREPIPDGVALVECKIK